jgi:opacity protein-like surface antigen
MSPRNIIKTAIFTGMAAFSLTSAKATEQGIYTKLDAGVSFITGMDIAGFSTSWKTGFATNGIVGLNLNEHFALELEGGWATNGLRSVGPAAANGIDLSMWSGFGNLVLKTNVAESLSVFVAGGPGFIHGSLEGNGAVDASDTIFAAQAKTGVSLKVTEQVSIDLTYRARFAGRFDISPGTRASSSVNQQITAGISIGF